MAAEENFPKTFNIGLAKKNCSGKFSWRDTVPLPYISLKWNFSAFFVPQRSFFASEEEKEQEEEKKL